MATLLLANVGEVLPFLFVIVAIATGIINYFREKSAAEAAKKNRRPSRRRDEDMDNDIEMFLDEVAAPDEREQQRPKRKRPRQSQQKRPQRKRPQREQREETAERKSVADRHMQSSVSDRHVQSSVGDRHVESKVENRRLEPNVEAAGPQVRRRKVPAATPIGRMFQSSNGVRTAIILNEILSPPPGRRSDS